MNRFADLHRHLDGSLRLETLRELAAAQSVRLPERLVFSKSMGLSAALACFETTLSVLQSPAAVERVAAEICEDAAELAGFEIRFAPQLHRGASMASIVDAALSGIAGRGGLILCALYGEPPELVEALVDLAAARPGVVAIDLAGGPHSGHEFSMIDYAPAFTRAKSVGIHRTVHAGEGRPPAELRVAIEALHAERIGHGTTLLEDPAVVELLLRREVTLEACPTSNVHTGVIESVAEHPLPQWLELGLKVAVCTDNTLLSAVTLADEIAAVAALAGMTDEKMARLARCSREALFER